MDGSNELNKIELDFFLKGNTSLDSSDAKKTICMVNRKWMERHSEA